MSVPVMERPVGMRARLREWLHRAVRRYMDYVEGE